MSDNIDKRIVEMSFDNAKFEKGISQSTKSLNEFNKSLNFDGATSAVERFSASFTKMGAVTFGIIQNLTNRVVNFGLRALKSLTFQPLVEGMGDYNTKLTTMQTITNATGKTIEEVEQYFSQLDEYADKTIYNLTDMTSAMSKFTNAGVSLDKSTPAIKGIANMTALAGQNASSASIAYYNLSQSIAGGFLSRMDFKSLELANVATIEWKQHMVDAAVAAGTLTKSTNGYKTATGKTFAMQQLFVDGLQEQWATTDVLLKVLGEYGDETTEIGKKAMAAAQDVKSFGMMVETLRAAIGTGWTRSFELIFGDLEEGKELWTNVTKAAGAFLDTIANGRNTMLEFWHDNGGREAFIKGMRNAAIALVMVLLAMSKGIDQIFPPQTQEQFVNMFKTFEHITSLMIISEETAGKLQRTFAGLFAVAGIGVDVLKFFGSILGQIVKTFFPGFGGGVLDITANLGDFLVALHSITSDGKLFQGMLSRTGSFIEGFASGLESAFYILVSLISKVANGSATFKDVSESLSDFVASIINFLPFGKDFSESFATALENVQGFTAFTSSKVMPMLDWLAEKLSHIGLREVGIIAIGVGLIAISKTILKAFNPIGNVLNGFASILKSTSDAIKGFTLNVKAQALLTISKAIALLVVSLIALTFVPADKLAIGLGALTVMMAELVGSLLLLNKIQNPAKIGMQLTALSAGLYIISKAAASFATISWEGLGKAGAAIAGFMGILLLFVKLLSGKDIGKFEIQLTSFSVGLVALSGALFVLSKIPVNTLTQGIGALAALLGMLVVYSKLISSLDFLAASKGMINFSLGVIALTGALAILGNLSFSTLLQGSIALTALLSILALYVKMVNGKDWTKANTGLVGLGVGLLALTGALVVLGNLPFDTLAKGSIALLSLLSVLALFIKMTNGKDLAVTGGSLIGLGVGLMALTAALAVLGSIDFTTLVQGTLGITLLMTAIAAFIKLTNGADLGVTAGGMIAFAAGIGMLAGVLALLTLLDTASLMAASGAITGLVVAIGLFSKLTNLGGLVQAAIGLGVFALALAALSIPIKMIADIPWQQLATTAGVIVGAIGMFALLAAVMPVFAAIGPVIPAAMLGVLGVGAVVLEIGLLIAAFGALSKIPGATEIINDGGAMLLAIGNALGNFVGGIIGGIGEGVTASLPTMANNISAFGVAIQPFFESVKGIDGDGVQAVKYLAETLFILGAAAVADGISSWLTGGSSLTTFAAELKAFAPDFVSFSNTIASGNINADLIKKTAAAAQAMAELATGLPNQGDSVAKWFVGDNTLSVFAAELKAFAPDFVTFANTIANGNINADVVVKTANAAQAMSELANTLPNQGDSVAKWFVGDNTLSTFASELAAFAPDFVYFANTIANGKVDTDVVNKTANAAQAMSALASTLPNQGTSVASWFVGDNTLSVFASELAAFAPDFVSFARELTNANIDGDVVAKTAVAAQAMAELAHGLPNQGGMAAWFSGDNSLSSFADELVKFAPKFSEFANSFGSIKSETILPGIEALNLLVTTMQLSGKDSMDSLSKGFEKNKESNISKIKTVLEGVVKAIDKYTENFTASGENIVKGLIKGIKNKKSEIRDTVEEVVVATVDDTIHTGFDMHSPSKTKEEDGKNLIQGLIDGVIEKKDELISSIKAVTEQAGDSANTSSLTSGLEGLLESLTSSFGDSGTAAGEAFSSGLSDSSYTSALSGMTTNVKSEFEKFKDWLDEEKFYGRIDTSGEIEKWKEQQKIYAKGTEERKEIDRQLYTLEKQLIQETYQVEIDAMDKKKYYGKLSTQEELDTYLKMRDEYKKGSEIREEIDRKIFELRNKLVDESYQKESDAIEKLNYYGQLSLKEELKMYREMRKEYKKGSDEREQIDRKIFELEKKIYETQKQYVEDVQAAQEKASQARLKAQQEYDQAVSEAESDAANDQLKAQKKYDETIADAQKDAEKKLVDAYDKYNDSVQKALDDSADERVKIEEDLASDIKNIQEKLFKDLDSAEKKYTDAVKSRADAIYGYYNLFDSVSEREVSTPEELLKNLSDQNAAIEDWRSSLQQLETRGVSDALIKELQQLGVSSSGQLSAMLAMTDEQLTEYVALFDRKHELANTQAVNELIDYRAEINNEIAELYRQADADITDRVAKYNSAITEMNANLQNELNEAQTTLDKSLTDINTTLTEKMTEAQYTYDNTLAEINQNLQEKLMQASTTLNNSMTQINQDLAEQLKTLKKSFDTTMESVHDKTTSEYRALNKDLKKQLEGLNTEVDTQLETLTTTTDTKTDAAATVMADNVKTGTDNAEQNLTDLNKSVDSILSDFERSLYNIGLNGAYGLANGLRAGQSAVRSAGQAIGNAALTGAKVALNINSPSKEMEELGMYSDFGLANGLQKYAHRVSDASSNVGQSALDGLVSSLSTLSALDLDMLDLAPTITPVLDLSAIQQGASIIDGLLSSDKAYSIASSSLNQTQRTQAPQNGANQPATTTITNVFKLEGLSVRSDTDIDLIANKLYQKQEIANRGHGLRTGVTGRR